MKMSRTWARASILLAAGFAALLFLGAALRSPALLYAALAMALAAFAIKFFVLRCPHCGWRGGSPQWSKSGTIHCPGCGRAFEYDR